MSSSGQFRSRPVEFLLESTSPKLKGIASLLKGCVDSAKLFVRGTESQKQLNHHFGNFCRTAVVGVPDIEEGLWRAAEEKRHTGGGEYVDVSEASFLSDVCAYVSHHSGGKVSQAYLDGIVKSCKALAAAESRSTQQRVDVEAAKLTKKRQRQPEKAPVVASAMQTHGNAAGNLNGAGGAAGLSPALNVQSPVGALRPTPFALDGGGGSPAHKPHAKLTHNTAYQPILMPWTSSLPYTHGVVLDRVGVDRPHHHGSQPANHAGATASAVCPTILSICSCDHPQEMMQRWEEREQFFSADAPTSASSSLAMMRTESSTASLNAANATAASSSQPTATQPDASPILRPLSPPGGPDGGPASAQQHLTFFPATAVSNSDVVDAAPQAFLVQLVHFGVTSAEPLLHSGKGAVAAS